MHVYEGGCVAESDCTLIRGGVYIIDIVKERLQNYDIVFFK